MNNHQSAGYANAAAMVAAAVAEDTDTVWRLIGDTVAGENVRETLVCLASVAGAYALALSDLKREPIADLIDRLAGEAANAVAEEGD